MTDPNFDPGLGDDLSAIMAALDDVWQFFEEVDPLPDRRGMDSKRKRAALMRGKRLGFVTSSRDGVYGKTRYATTAEGDQWMHGGRVEDFVTVPSAEHPSRRPITGAER